ncbi:MAG: PilZ domain-containing protein [Aquisalimonadaceae bacterium]
MRRFVRHPAAIPIEVRASGQPAHALRDVSNVSLGGLAFQSDIALEPGVLVEVLIPCVCPRFESMARVVWCEIVEGGAELGVEFLNAEDAFRARMVEQVCHIEQYRERVAETEGRVLTSAEAAGEWIGKYAAQFPSLDSEDAD